jgi:hypothetical protein
VTDESNAALAGRLGDFASGRSCGTHSPSACNSLAHTTSDLPRPDAQDEARAATKGSDSSGMRAERRSGSIFDAPDPDHVEPAASSEWAAATTTIADDMRAHLARARKRMQADLIGSDKGPLTKAFLGVTGFFRSRYFRNVRRSLTVFVSGWLWYVLNTKTYTPPEYDD